MPSTGAGERVRRRGRKATTVTARTDADQSGVVHGRDDTLPRVAGAGRAHFVAPLPAREDAGAAGATASGTETDSAIGGFRRIAFAVSVSEEVHGGA